MRSKVTFAISSGPLAGRAFVFQEHDTFLCGRNSDCHARILKDPRISRHHFLLEVNPPQARLRDLGSLNGTYFNGRKIGGREFFETPADASTRNYPEVELHDGDRIVIGKTTIDVRIELPSQCSICGCQLPSDGDRTLCPECQRAPATMASPLPAVVPKCAQCGKDIAQEAGTAPVGRYVCGDCREAVLDHSDGMYRLVEQAIRDSAGPHQATLLDNYHICEQLGRGGMGAVYRALRRADGSTVAVKMMLARVAVDEDIRQAFLREIKTVGQLDHPHIVHMLDSDSAGSTFYFVMEYCAGGNLHELLKRQGGRLPLAQIGALLEQALDGLAYAHRAGFVHRDLKPQNLLIAAGGDRASILKIGDFGLAKQFDLAGLSGMTATGNFGGTFHFMPREQLTNFKYALPASDVWSLAATFYYALTGHYPLEFGPERDPIEVLLHDEPVPIWERSPEIPEALAVVFDRALSSDLKIRYPDAEAMRTDVKRASA